MARIQKAVGLKKEHAPWVLYRIFFWANTIKRLHKIFAIKKEIKRLYPNSPKIKIGQIS